VPALLGRNRRRPQLCHATGGGLALAGAGNTADLTGTDTLVQQSVPAGLLGRVFGTVYAAAQLASVIAYAAAAPLVALTGPGVTFVIAGTGHEQQWNGQWR